MPLPTSGKRPNSHPITQMLITPAVRCWGNLVAWTKLHESGRLRPRLGHRRQGNGLPRFADSKSLNKTDGQQAQTQLGIVAAPNPADALLL